MNGLSKLPIWAADLFLLLLSFLIVSAAQPDWSGLACLLTSSIGYALFWVSISKIKYKFPVAMLWFACVQLIHLSWFFSDRYVGIYIYPFLAIATLFLGLQFALTTKLIGNIFHLSILKALAVSGLWVIMEWSRLFILSGFSWNPSGIALSGSLYGMQFASLIGVFGLSFWIMFTNLMALKWLITFSWRQVAIWGGIASLPYMFGFIQIQMHTNKIENSADLKAVLVQTALTPEEKNAKGPNSFTPLQQWARILDMVAPYYERPIDVIVLSEAVVPYGTDYGIYLLEDVKNLFHNKLGKSDFLPSMESESVGNSFFAQSLANAFQAEVVIGLEDVVFKMEDSIAYNSAFLFHPFSPYRDRYEKRVLVPMGEYIPFNWCRKFLSKYGIEGAFTAGKEAKVFNGKCADFAMSICYEETYGHLVRESRKKGADILVNLTNDVWYPHSRLPMVHFLHGRLRTVENGIPILRSCNTGVTCGLDSLGRIVRMLDFEKKGSKSPAAALYLSLPLYSFSTVYSFFGDWSVLSLSFLSLFSLAAFETWQWKEKKWKKSLPDAVVSLDDRQN